MTLSSAWLKQNLFTTSAIAKNRLSKKYSKASKRLPKRDRANTKKLRKPN